MYEYFDDVLEDLEGQTVDVRSGGGLGTSALNR